MADIYNWMADTQALPRPSDEVAHITESGTCWTPKTLPTPNLAQNEHFSPKRDKS